MQTEEIEIAGEFFKIKEISLDQSLELGGIKDSQELTRRLLEVAVEPSINEEYRKKISMKDGLKLIKAINALNGLDEDFLSSLGTKNIENGK